MDPINRDLQRRLPQLIRLWRRQARTRWGAENSEQLEPAEAKSVAAGIRKLSAGLTGARTLAGDHYFRDPAMVGAYLLYYWPVSYVQARLGLGLLRQPPRAVLELGGGGGPLAAAAADLDAERCVVIDRSPKALEWAASLLQAPGLQTSTQVQDLAGSDPRPWPPGGFDCIGAQHAFNELAEDVADRVAEKAFSRLSEDGRLLVIEPALKSTSQASLRLRDRLLQAGRALEFPCTHSTACPALAQDDSCHAEADWSPPPLIRDLISRAGLQKKTLKMTVLLFAPKEQARAEGLFRVVSAVGRAVDRSLYVELCGPSGRIDLVLPARTGIAELRAAFKKLNPGELLRISNVAPHPRGWALTAVSQLTRVATASCLRVLA